MSVSRNQYKFQVLNEENWSKEVSYFFLGKRTNTWIEFLEEGWHEDSSQPVQDVLVTDAETPVAAILQKVDKRTLKIFYVFFQTDYCEDVDGQIRRLTEILTLFLIHAREVLSGKEIPEFDEVEFMNTVDGVAYFAKNNLAALDLKRCVIR